MKAAGLALCLALCAPAGTAQTASAPPGRSALETIASDVSRGARDAGAIIASPLHFTARQWAVTAGVVGGTALLFTADRTIRSFALRNHSPAANAIFDVGREYGREIYGLSLGGGLYIGGLAFGHDAVRTTGRMLIESVAIAGAINIAVKSVVGRSRPQTGEGPYAFHGFETSLEHTALTSGHATVAFAVSSVLARRIGNPYATAGLYALAGATALSRVYHDNHWFTDSFLGAALGTAVGISVTCGSEAGASAGLHVRPALSGVRLDYEF